MGSKAAFTFITTYLGKRNNIRIERKITEISEMMIMVDNWVNPKKMVGCNDLYSQTRTF